MPNLQRLRLERTKVTDAGMAHLSKLAKLDYLNLYGTEITDAGLKPLESLEASSRSTSGGRRSTPPAAKAFAEAMTDQAKIDGMKKQIAALQAQIKDEQIEVVQGVAAASQPAAPQAVAAAPAAPAPAAPTNAAPAAVRHRQHRLPRLRQADRPDEVHRLRRQTHRLLLRQLPEGIPEGSGEVQRQDQVRSPPTSLTNLHE
jgi:hypothetical protein